jgi:D-threo-aldose 1-dehydrogenase
MQKRRIANTQIEVTELGFGGAPLGAVGSYIDESDAEMILTHALRSGINYFDTAPLYGHGLSEKRLGRILANIDRGDFVLSTKVGRRLVDPSLGVRNPQMRDEENKAIRYDYSYDGARRSIEESLERLGLDRIDIVFCHDIGVSTHGETQPAVFQEACEGILPALSQLRAEGVIGAFGLGVNDWQVCEDVLGLFDVDVFLLAGRFTLAEQTALDTFLPKCEAREISVVIGGPYNSGALTVAERRKATYDYKPVDDAQWQLTQRLGSLCATHGVDLGAAALQYPLRHKSVASVIPGCWKMQELEQNLQRVHTPTPDTLWKALDEAGLATYLPV